MRLDRARPSGSRTVGQPNDLDRQRQVGDQAADDRQLLEVLLAEVGPARPGQGEQLGHDGRHPVEVARAATIPSRTLGQALDAHVVRGGSGHSSSVVGANTRWAPASAGQPAVVVEIAGIGGQVLGRPELQRIDVVGHRHHVAVGAARRINDRCPACSAPIVGTSPTRWPVARQASSLARHAAGARMSSRVTGCLTDVPAPERVPFVGLRGYRLPVPLWQARR